MRSNKLLVFAVLCFIVIGVLAAMDVDELDGKVFYTADKIGGDRSYYQASISQARDPLTVYNESVKMSMVSSVSKCKLYVQTTDKQLYLNTYYAWVGESNTPAAISMRNGDCQEYILADGCMLSGIYEDGDSIVVPMDNMKFLDANTDYSDAKDIRITLGGGTYKFVFSNVKSWFCHNGESDATRHSSVVGIGGEVTNVSKGQIVGQATANTTVKLYALNTQGLWEPYSFYDFYGLSSAIEGD